MMRPEIHSSDKAEIKATHHDHEIFGIDEHQVLGGSLGIITTFKLLDDASEGRRRNHEDT